jgi:hypothetical protein
MNDGFIVAIKRKGEHVVEARAQSPSKIYKAHGDTFEKTTYHSKLIIALFIIV